MKKYWYGIVLVASLYTLLVMRYSTIKYPITQSYSTSPLPIIPTNDIIYSNPLKFSEAFSPPIVQKNPEIATKVNIPTEFLLASLFAQRNISNEEQKSLQTWNHLNHLVEHSQGLPNAVEAIKEAGEAWNNLMASVQESKLIGYSNESSSGKKEKQCPYFLNKNINGAKLGNNDYKLRIPCGLTQGSSITVFGTPNGINGDFRIDLRGDTLLGEPNPPIILHYNVRLHGDETIQNPVIVQNTWTVAHDWGEEERCPSPTSVKEKKVDELEQCNKIVGNSDVKLVMSGKTYNASRESSLKQDGSKPRKYFPFKQGYPFVATLRLGSEGIQMTVDGKHITSFAYRDALEPWVVSEVKISGDLNLNSILASGLPTSEDSEHIIGLESIKAIPISFKRPLELFVGVFSTSNNFNRRMAVRRTWMQYPAIRSGTVAVRFFVGLHKNKVVNEQVWNEAKTYGDVQLMPFVDYYNLITWKTLATCIFGIEFVSANFVMKTDDDAFVRIDEVLASLKRINVTQGLLYGLIKWISQPDRNTDSMWFISFEEWPEENYPPWAHGAGYVISRDIAKAVVKMNKKGRLKMLKIEDVAMGVWIADMKKEGLKVHYENEERIYLEVCKDGYVVAHYQGPQEMLCLWQKLQEGVDITYHPRCCGNR